MSAARRFYEKASVAPDATGFSVALDTRTLKTPRGARFAAPTRALAEEIAAEWNAQDERILPSTMPLTQLAFAATDTTDERRAELIGYVVKFGETDHCCHRAASPPDLAARQAAVWDPLVAWGAETLGLQLRVVVGVIPADADASALGRLRELTSSLDDFHLTALAQGCGLSGSALIAWALLKQRVTAAEAFAAAMLDESYQLDTWGEDDEARARLDRVRGEIDALACFVSALDAA